MFGALLMANAAAWLWAWDAFGDRPALLGTALLAWVFGLRHAVDADHIAAIDNVVRKLMQDGQRPIGVGLFFSLGHASVVFLACAVIAATAATIPLEAVREVTGTIGTAVSASFLMLIGLGNLLILRQVWGQLRHVRRDGRLPAQPFDAAGPQGLLTRLLRPALRAIRRSWQMYPLGFLFGLGFDTATEIGLMAIAATQAAGGLHPWEVLVFPALFTAGMTLVDSADSILMVGAYEWAFVDPLRKLWYNLTITAASVAVALLIGGVEAAGMLADRLSLDGPAWRFVATLNEDVTLLGCLVIGIFVLAWIVSAGLYRWAAWNVRPATAQD
ncbi:MAG: nickel transporter [Rhodospirillales bacterium 69-11]|nr:MAG: nickel transporter [Rhodospirillales bacterium 69-11]